MNELLTARLRSAAELTPQGSRVADVGTDHGYLAIWLLLSGRADSVIASDLRPLPLETARANARRYGVGDRIRFELCDGLEAVAPGEADCVIMAGMGGETIAKILSAAPWTKNSAVSIVMQPMSAGNDLRRFLAAEGYVIERECLSKEGRLYCALRARYSGPYAISPGEEYISRTLEEGGDALLGEYRRGIIKSLLSAAEGARNSKKPQDKERWEYFRQAAEELQEAEK